MVRVATFDISAAVCAASKIDLAFDIDLDTGTPANSIPIISLPHLSPQSKPKPSNQSAANQRRKKCRAAVVKAHGHLPKPDTIETIIHTALPQHIDFSTTHLPHVRGAFTAKCKRFATTQLKQLHLDEMKRERSVEELVAAGFMYVPWQGKSTYFVDCNNYVFAAVAAAPQKGNYAAAAERLFDHISTLSLCLPAAKPHRRGDFPVLNFGIHHGQGLQEPFNISLSDDASKIVEELSEDADFQRLCGFQSGKARATGLSKSLNSTPAAFQVWFPELFAHYKETMDQVRTRLPQLRFPVEKSVFPGVTVNFGRRVATYRHRDINNLAYGMCAITPLGQFDHTRSAQLVLEEAKLVIEVPSAATAFIMSAPCTHSNLPIAEGDTRVSFTQYAAGPIFCYVQNRCMMEEALRKANPPAWKANQALKDDAWARGVSLLPTIEKIIEY